MFITPDLLRKRYGRFDPNVFTRWQRRGLVRKLRKEVYLNTAKEPPHRDGLFVLAGRQYTPSYISLHTALNFWGLIPEYVVEVHSITTLKPLRMTNDGIRYRYRSVQPEMFFGYEWVDWKGGTYKIARPEKTMIDFAHFWPEFSDPDWLYEMRFDPWELAEMDWERMDRYLAIINSPTLNTRIDTLIKTYEL